MATSKTRGISSFALRFAFPWGAAVILGWMILQSTARRFYSFPNSFWLFAIAFTAVVGCAVAAAVSHYRRVRLIAGDADADDATLAMRHRREVELPMEANEAFNLIEATIRELPRVEGVESELGSLQVRARVRRHAIGIDTAMGMGGTEKTLDTVTAIVIPGEMTSNVRLMCEPQSGAWIDWFMVDNGANLQNMASVTRSLTRRLSERIREQQTREKQAAIEKELAVAKLGLLQAQVEPHFLYNTLASAQYLVRTDPARSDQMLGHLIDYLRRALPRDDAASTLGEELHRAQAYLEILRIRMGERLTMNIDVSEELKRVPMPAMMLQTLVENAIKHGLEPQPGGGSIWIIARAREGQVSVTVADDGRGLSTENSGTGIGLKNVRERLRLAYGDAASFAITSNFPKGVAATITVPDSPATAEEEHA